jgi:hypothetical protein
MNNGEAVNEGLQARTLQAENISLIFSHLVPLSLAR